ncbi:hypothetical protein T440DRAFT_171907 [Plenodomus tracheiphilus IPT5]|uniref:Secreted protein n=1 Tax=Plenodomus tracheiphilus IPT5 TaxID=1408161 RepID=A0A6A7B275_9PLEO|nr:hypothetical protein T440DRAFT_171907 [Plenodomus tracheiphilus IPT5]
MRHLVLMEFGMACVVCCTVFPNSLLSTPDQRSYIHPRLCMPRCSIVMLCLATKKACMENKKAPNATPCLKDHKNILFSCTSDFPARRIIPDREGRFSQNHIELLSPRPTVDFNGNTKDVPM